MMLDTILQGDAWQLAKTLPDQSVQCIVTSPPYWGLRDYGTAQWDGGDPACDHIASFGGHLAQSAASTRGGAHKQAESQTLLYRDVCGKCGARRIDSQFGLEPTIGEYVARLVELFRELRRALRDDGTIWINLGDSFSDKNLCMIPARVAIALCDDGWWLRSEIIWHKLAPMPESVTDRPTRAHEYVFLLSKRATYYYDADAVREEAETFGRQKSNRIQSEKNLISVATGQRNGVPRDTYDSATRNRRSVWTLGPESFSGWTQTSRLQPVERHDVSDDTNCKVSPDCPVHAGLFDWAATDSYDVRVGDLLSRTSRKRTRRAPKLVFGSAPIVRQRGAVTAEQSSDFPHQAHSLFATDHSNGNHRTAPDPVTNPAYTPSAQSVARTDDIQARLGSAEPVPNKPLSNISGAGLPSNESSQIPDRIVGSDMLPDSFVASLIPPECTCSFYHETTENTSHFAVMPTKLVEPCIKAGTSARGCCPVCGAPWVRVVERTPMEIPERVRSNRVGVEATTMVNDGERRRAMNGKAWAETAKSETTGWRPTCDCKVYQLKEGLTAEQIAYIHARLEGENRNEHGKAMSSMRQEHAGETEPV